jgi:hypothetical protein
MMYFKLEAVEIADLPCNYNSASNVPVSSWENVTVFRNKDSLIHKVHVMPLGKMQITLFELLQAWNVISQM